MPHSIPMPWKFGVYHPEAEDNPGSLTQPCGQLQDRPTTTPPPASAQNEHRGHQHEEPLGRPRNVATALVGPVSSDNTPRASQAHRCERYRATRSASRDSGTLPPSCRRTLRRRPPRRTRHGYEASTADTNAATGPQADTSGEITPLLPHSSSAMYRTRCALAEATTRSTTRPSSGSHLRVRAGARANPTVIYNA